MARFDVGGVSLRVPGKALTGDLKTELESGNYEWNEALAINRHATQGDRVLDVGAGAGFISILAARKVGAQNVVCVEANPDMQQALRQNLDQNGAPEATLIHGAVVPDAFEGDHVPFALSDAFWASSLADEDSKPEQVVEVPPLKLCDLFARHKPSIVCLDVEGGELALCQQVWPEHVRLVIMEIHTKKYPPSSVKAIFDGMSRNNMTLMPWGTRGEVIVLQRCDT